VSLSRRGLCLLEMYFTTHIGNATLNPTKMDPGTHLSQHIPLRPTQIYTRISSPFPPPTSRPPSQVTSLSHLKHRARSPTTLDLIRFDLGEEHGRVLCHDLCLLGQGLADDLGQAEESPVPVPVIVVEGEALGCAAFRV
jgi:hypothetical protein